MMLMRTDIELREHAVLSPLAAFADESRGRRRPEEPDGYRTCFQRDRDRILHCKSFRRLSHKTQVFLAAEGDHYRTRLTHTLEVQQISRTIARALGLNEDLTETIALGHDLGHTPFGHTGEFALSHALALRAGADPEGGERGRPFRHNEQSLRVVDVLEKDGQGLNLTWEVRDGILCHTGTRQARTLEGRIVATSDRIAYVNHDIDDAIRGGIIDETQLPVSTHALLGASHGERISTLVSDMIAESDRVGDIRLSPPIWDAIEELRTYLFDNVYTRSDAKEEEPKARRLIGLLFDYYMAHVEEVPEEYRRVADGQADRAVTDYVAGMTDRYALHDFERLYVPSSWHG